MYIPRWLVAIVAVVGLLTLAAFQQQPHLTIAQPTSPDFNGATVHPSQLRSYFVDVQASRNAWFSSQVTASLPGPSGFVVTDVLVQRGNLSGNIDIAQVEILEGSTVKAVVVAATNNNSGGTFALPGTHLHSGIPLTAGQPLNVRVRRDVAVSAPVRITITGYVW